jgi:hypothetical protein
VTARGHELEERQSVRDTVAGFLAAFVHFAAPVALVYYPGRIGPGTMLVALIAAAISSRSHPLVWTAVLASAVWWFAGMTIAIALERPIF